MKIFKFGGASVRDAEGIKNVVKVLESQGYDSCLVVVSAMGKTTNALEEVVEAYFSNEDYRQEVERIKQAHVEIVQNLFKKGHGILDEIDIFFDDIESFLRRNKSPNYNFVYDQVVTCGEVISSKILSAYLLEKGIVNEWLDARDYVKTDTNYREGLVNW